MITVTNSKGETVDLKEDEGLYELPNTAEEKTEVSAEIKASKLLKGRGWQNGDRFTFTITPDDETFPVPPKTEVAVSDDKEVSFGEITFVAEGIYTYTIREKAGSIKGITYDNADHKAVVTVKDNGKDNTLVAEVKYEDSESETSAVITNTYKEDSSDEEDDKEQEDDKEGDSGKIEEETSKEGTADKKIDAGGIAVDQVRTGDESGLSHWIIIAAITLTALIAAGVIRILISRRDG